MNLIKSNFLKKSTSIIRFLLYLKNQKLMTLFIIIGSILDGAFYPYLIFSFYKLIQIQKSSTFSFNFLILINVLVSFEAVRPNKADFSFT